MAPVKPGHFYQLLQDKVEMFPSEEWPDELETDVAAFIDPRTTWMGARILCNEQSLELDDGEFKRAKNDKEYHWLRSVLGIAEGSKELANTFPLNMNLHHLNAISFDKGCYIGQELTQRTFHTGVIRRMALPYLVLSKANSTLKIDPKTWSPMHHIDPDFDTEIIGEPITFSQGDKVTKLGKIIS